MADSSKARFGCPNCGKQFRWKPQIAGKKFRCKACGQIIRASATPNAKPDAVGPPPSPEASTYELDFGDDQPEATSVKATDGKCPGCNTKLKPEAVICLNCGFNLQEGKQLETSVGGQESGDSGAAPTSQGRRRGASNLKQFAGLAAAGGKSSIALELEGHQVAEENKLLDLHLPMILITVGFASTMLLAYSNPDLGINQWYIDGLIRFGTQVLFMAPFMLAMAYLVTKMPQVTFGPLGVGVIKLTAISVGPLALADLIMSHITAYTIGLEFYLAAIIYLAICAPFLKLMFDLDLGKIAITLVLIVALQIILKMFVIATVLGLLS